MSRWRAMAIVGVLLGEGCDRPPGDGVIPGRYKVFLTVEKTFAGCESLVPARYAAAATTPFEVTVDSRANKPFRIQIDPR